MQFGLDKGQNMTKKNPSVICYRRVHQCLYMDSDVNTEAVHCNLDAMNNKYAVNTFKYYHHSNGK